MCKFPLHIIKLLCHLRRLEIPVRKPFLEDGQKVIVNYV